MKNFIIMFVRKYKQMRTFMISKKQVKSNWLEIVQQMK
jgi:hypothetical protein